MTHLEFDGRCVEVCAQPTDSMGSFMTTLEFDSRRVDVGAQRTDPIGTLMTHLEFDGRREGACPSAQRAWEVS